MNIEIKEHCLFVHAENDKEKFSNETSLYFAIKVKLLKLGYNVIKKCPGKDGHLTSAPYYIRDQKHKFCWIDNNYAVRALNEEFNKYRSASLQFIKF
jgi:hypothetical protein